MSDNKVNNKLDFRNVKVTQFDPGQVSKMTFSELQSSVRTYSTNAILKDAYTHFVQDVNVDGEPTKVTYYQATHPARDRLNFASDVAGSLAGSYLTLQDFITKQVYVFYYVVSGSGVAPGIGDVEIPVVINANDTSALVAYATREAIKGTEEFIVIDSNLLANYVDIEYLQFGETQAVNVGTTGFLATRINEGESFVVGQVELDYDISGNPIYNKNVLKGLKFNIYTASFDAEREEIEVSAVVSMDPVISKDPTVYNVDMPFANIEYSLALPLDTKRFQLNIRDHRSKYTVSWVTGGAVLTRSPGTVYEESGLQIIAGKDTIYFTGKKDDLVMEVITWK